MGGNDRLKHGVRRRRQNEALQGFRWYCEATCMCHAGVLRASQRASYAPKKCMPRVRFATMGVTLIVWLVLWCCLASSMSLLIVWLSDRLCSTRLTGCCGDVPLLTTKDVPARVPRSTEVVDRRRCVTSTGTHKGGQKGDQKAKAQSSPKRPRQATTGANSHHEAVSTRPYKLR